VDPPQHTIPLTSQTSVPVADISSEATLLKIISMQQEQNAAMAERQNQQHERLLTLLEDRRRHTPARTVTVTTVTQSSEPVAGTVTIIPPRNYDNLAIAGVSLPPMFRLEGRITTLAMDAMKSDLDSSSHDILEEDHQLLMDNDEKSIKKSVNSINKSGQDSSPLLPLDEDNEDNKRLIKYISRNNSIKIKTGIPIKWFLIKRICINFNIGSCTRSTNHLNNSKKMVLRHICGSCLLHRRIADTTHTAVSCRFRPQSFY
jgi:hypothetical protein